MLTKIAMSLSVFFFLVFWINIPEAEVKYIDTSSWKPVWNVATEVDNTDYRKIAKDIAEAYGFPAYDPSEGYRKDPHKF